MKSIISLTSAGYALVAVVAVAAFVFAVVPNMPEVPSASEVSTKVLEAFACCGGDGNDGGPDGGASEGDGGSTFTIGDVFPPTCSITRSDNEINLGESVIISWAADNAKTITLNGESVSKLGSKSFTPNSAGIETYTIKASNILTSVTCETTVKVVEPPAKAPTCTLEATPSLLMLGQSVSISWTTDHTHAVTLNGVLVSEDGSVTDTPGTSGTKTYTLKAVGDGGSVQCTDTVTVTIPDAGKSCTDFGFDFDVAKYDWNGTKYVKTFEKSGHTTSVSGNSKTATWTAGPAIAGAVAKAATSFETFSGGTSGTVSKSAIGNGQHDISNIILCGKKIEVPKTPVCNAFTASPTSLPSGGGTVTLTWDTDFGDTVTIDNGIGSVLSEGTAAVTVFDDITYTLTVKKGDMKDVCSVSINVDEPKEEEPKRPQCPFTSGEGRTVVTFNEKIRSDKDENNARTAHKNVSLGAGTYKVTLFSWDGYIGREQHSQPNESWKLAFFKDGSEITRSNAIGDLTDAVREAQKQETVNTALVLSGTSNTVKGIHAVFPDNTSPNSVFPICALIEKKDEPKPKDPVCDAFTADRTSLPSGGGNVVLSWMTSHGDSVVIDNGVGTVIADGTTTVSVADDITYTLTVTGNGKTDTCSVQIEVAEPEPDAPLCDAFSVSPSLFTNGTGGDVTITWDTSNTDSVVIDNGVGTVGTRGSTTVLVSTTTTFTLTASGNGKTDSCTGTVTVEESASDLACTLTTSANTIGSGVPFVLTWDTTGAISASIDQNIGTVALDGSREVTVNANTTFTLTASDGAREIQCTASVSLQTGGGGGGGGGGGSSRPRCDLEANRSRINAGEEVVLSWNNTRTNDILLRDNRGNVLVDTEDNDEFDEDEDSITVRPDRDTRYTLIAERGSREDECFVDIEIVSDVTVTSSRSQPPLVAGISLSNVPYTGFEAGPLLTTVFYLLLTIWSLGVAYFLVIKREPVLGVSVPGSNRENGNSHDATDEPHEISEPYHNESIRKATTAPAPVNLPTGNFDRVIGYAAQANETDVSEMRTTQDGADDAMNVLENRAHEFRVLLSSDTVRFIMERGKDIDAQFALLDELIERVKASYPSEDGWFVINRERISVLYDENVPAPVSETPREDMLPVSVSAAAPKTGEPVGASSLAEAVVTKNVSAATHMLGNNPMFALTDAATDLDNLYRHRKGAHVVVSDMLMRAAQGYTDAQLEAAIEALTDAIDGTYRDEKAAVKLAIMKAVKVLS